mgnify:CR=1 FL=1
MELAVIKTGGKQYVVSAGSLVTIEKLPGDLKKGDAVTFSEVLLTDDGSKAALSPSTKVTGTVAAVGRAKKIEVMKYKAKSRYLKRRGHRQPYVKVKIDKIG